MAGWLDLSVAVVLFEGAVFLSCLLTFYTTPVLPVVLLSEGDAHNLLAVVLHVYLLLRVASHNSLSLSVALKIQLSHAVSSLAEKGLGNCSSLLVLFYCPNLGCVMG